jgi:tetratricopeptide (TPR) repeat protein
MIVAYLDPTFLDLVEGYRANALLLQEPGVTDEMLAWCWSTRRETLQRMGKRDLLADIDAVGGDQRWAGALSRACDHFDEREFADASALLAGLANLKGMAPHIERRVWYLLALAARENGDFDTALGAFRQLEWRHAESVEATGSAAFSAAILLQQGEYDQAVVALNRAAQLNRPLDEATPIEVPSLPRMLATPISKLRGRAQYEQAGQLIDTYRRIEPGQEPDRLAIQLYDSWAAARLEEAKTQSPVDSKRLAYDAEELFRRAGTLSLAMSAAAETADESARWIWKAANYFVNGRGYLEAATALERYLASENVQNRARALALLCVALENSDRASLVAPVAERCINDFPDDGAAVTARYYLARSMIGFGELAQAEVQLRMVADATIAEADPAVTERAQLALAHILSAGREDEAISRLRGIGENASDPDTLYDGRLLLGDCLHQRAQRPAASAVESQTEHARLHYQHRKEADLDEALRVYSTLQRQLAALDRAGQLTDMQTDWLRRCRWGMANCLYEAGRIEESLDLYKLLADVYSNTPDWFAAQLQIANCHVRLNRIDTAVAVIRAAHLRLIELPPDAREQVRVGMAPERWKEWLEWGNRM